MRIVSRLLLLLFIALTLTGGVWGLASAQDQNMEPFTSAELDQFLADWPEFAKWAKQVGEKYNTGGQGALQNHMYSQKVLNHIKGMGWGDPMRFFYVLGHTSLGLATVQTSTAQPQMLASMEQQKQAIMNNPNMSAEQKQQILAQMEQAMAQMQQANQYAAEIPPEELALIKARKDEIMAVLRSARD